MLARRSLSTNHPAKSSAPFRFAEKKDCRSFPGMSGKWEVEVPLRLPDQLDNLFRPRLS